MDEKKHVISLTIVLFKQTVTDYREACENIPGLKMANVKDDLGFDGRIVYCDSKHSQPKWKTMVDALSESSIDLAANTSNKAAIIVKVSNRFMAVVLGYGKSLLREDRFERNFGLKTALNMLADNQMRSVQSATIEDMIVSTHKQASRRTSQDEFNLNSYGDILRCITGKPYNDDFGNTVSGKDTLSVSVAMNISELGEKLKLYLDAYQDTRYQKIGFKWVDNINEIRDPEMKTQLNTVLARALLEKKVDDIYIYSPEIIDPEMIIGFCFSGIRKNLDDACNYSFDPDFLEYIEKLDNKDISQIMNKIRKDKLFSMDLNGFSRSVGSIYSAIVWQCEYQQKTYFLWNGYWYYVEQSFLKEVNDYLQSIPKNLVTLPKCHSGESEGAYNKRVADTTELCLMDRKLIHVKGGPKQIESCDLFSMKKQLIHVKKRASSSQVSHLFSQGRVAAECFLSDESFRKQVHELVKKKLGDNVFDYKEKPNPNEYEIVYAIIAKKACSSVGKLPFFSKVNLMLTCQSLERINFKYSICFIEQE